CPSAIRFVMSTTLAPTGPRVWSSFMPWIMVQFRDGRPPRLAARVRPKSSQRADAVRWASAVWPTTGWWRGRPGGLIVGYAAAPKHAFAGATQALVEALWEMKNS